MTLTRRATICGLALCGAAALVAAARHAPPFREVSDGAILEIYTLQALKGTLLVGPYSRFGWHHPGPLYFYLQAPWYWLSGLHTAGMQAGAIAINVAALGVVAWTISRAATASTAAVVPAAVALYVVRAGDVIASPWNPHIIVLPLMAFIVAAAGYVATGRRSLMFWLVALASLLVQTHLATAPVVAIVGALAIASRVSLAGEEADSPARRTWVTASALAALLWLPAIVEQLTHRPGNLAQIVRFFANGSRDTVAPGIAAVAWASAMTSALAPGWTVASGLPFRAPDPIPTLAAAIAELCAVAFAAWWWRRRRSAFGMWLSVAVLAASLVGLASVTRIVDGIVDHEIFWLSGVGVLNAAVAAGAALDVVMVVRSRATTSRAGTVARRFPRGTATISAGVLAAAALATGAFAMRGVLQRTRTLDDHAVDVVADELLRQTSEAGVVRPLVRIDQSIWPIAAGALLEIAKTGRPFAVDNPWTTMYGDAFAANGREDGVVTIEGTTAAPRVRVERRR